MHSPTTTRPESLQKNGTSIICGAPGLGGSADPPGRAQVVSASVLLTTNAKRTLI